MPEITPEQNQQLKTWAGQRDALLSEISVLEETKKTRTEENNDLAQSSSKLTTLIQQSEGRIIELDKKEKEQEGIVSTEIAELTTKKGTLQTEVTGLETEVETLSTRKTDLTKDISTLTVLHDKVFNQVDGLHKTVLHVVSVTRDNEFAIDKLTAKLKVSVSEIVDITSKSAGRIETVFNKIESVFNELLSKLPFPTKKIKD